MNFKALFLLLLSVPLAEANPANAQISALTYQGQLLVNGIPANGNYDLRFILFDASHAGSQIGNILTNNSVPVANGLFTTVLDFGTNSPNVFNATSLWLEINMRTNGSANSFVVLSPRQNLTGSPYALYASNAGGINGVLTAANLPTNVAILDANQTFTGANAFTSRVGIGTTNPVAPLQVAGGGVAVTGHSSPYLGSSGVYLESTDLAGFIFAYDYFASTPMPLLLNSPGGNVGIGNANPATTLDVNGTVTAKAFNGTFNGNGTGLTNLPSPSKGNLITLSVAPLIHTGSSTNFEVPTNVLAQIASAYCANFGNSLSLNSWISVAINGETAYYPATSNGTVTNLPVIMGPATITLGATNYAATPTLSFCTIQTTTPNQGNYITLSVAPTIGTGSSTNYNVPAGTVAQITSTYCYASGGSLNSWITIGINGQVAFYPGSSSGAIPNLPIVVGPAIISLEATNYSGGTILSFCTIQTTP